MTAKKGGKVLYTAQTQTVGLLQGHTKSSDGRLDVGLTAPGMNGDGTNPEQLLASGWGACFALSLAHTAMGMGIELPDDTAIDTEVDLCNKAGDYTGEFYVQARLKVTMPGVEREAAQSVLDAAHKTCPYHLATRGNVDTEVTLA